MNLFKRKKKNDKDQAISSDLTRKIIEVLNYSPIDYEFPQNAYSEEDVKEVLKDFRAGDIDDLCGILLFPAIDSKINEEIEYGDKQYVKHIDTVRKLVDAARGEAKKALYLRKIYQEDRDDLIEQRKKLIEKRESL